MKKIIFTLGLAVLFSSCIIGSVVGGTISAAGSIVGGNNKCYWENNRCSYRR